MLYMGADIIRDIEWVMGHGVIFDEVHYVNDVERGVVWEEVVIMLPRHINVVLLSATVPNTIEFADWIDRTKQKRIRVTGTTKRPVPLEHCLFYAGELYKICENETFVPQGLRATKDAYKKKISSTVGGGSMHYGHPSGSGGARAQNRENPQGKQRNSNLGGQNNWGLRRSEASSWFQLTNKLSKKSLLPVVIFCFSKNRCDKSADNRNLSQILRVQSLLHRGIGVHHAGLLPIVKEVVEMFFCRGVIKLQVEFKLPASPEEYAQENLKFGLVEVVYEWPKGTPFANICELTDVPEGLIVRTIVRLDETCHEFKNAAAIMGNSALYKKMESASNAIKWDIVFAASLYITGM
ncbi:Antiviral helicase ski2 [Ancistrocladus abbreviatus]